MQLKGYCQSFLETVSTPTSPFNLRNDVFEFQITQTLNSHLSDANSKPIRYSQVRPRGYKDVFKLSSSEHKIFLLINVEMPTIDGILTFMRTKISILGLSEPEKN